MLYAYRSDRNRADLQPPRTYIAVGFLFFFIISCIYVFNLQVFDTTMVSHYDDEQYDTEDSEEYSEDDEEEEVQMKPIFIPKVLLHY